MKNYPLREIKKKSTKPEYCSFVGRVEQLSKGNKVPKRIACPTCKRRLEPTVTTCTGSYEDVGFACCINLTIKKHRAKK